MTIQKAREETCCRHMDHSYRLADRGTGEGSRFTLILVARKISILYCLVLLNNTILVSRIFDTLTDPFGVDEFIADRITCF